MVGPMVDWRRTKDKNPPSVLQEELQQMDGEKEVWAAPLGFLWLMDAVWLKFDRDGEERGVDGWESASDGG